MTSSHAHKLNCKVQTSSSIGGYKSWSCLLSKSQKLIKKTKTHIELFAFYMRFRAFTAIITPKVWQNKKYKHKHITLMWFVVVCDNFMFVVSTKQTFFSVIVVVVDSLLCFHIFFCSVFSVLPSFASNQNRPAVIQSLQRRDWKSRKKNILSQQTCLKTISIWGILFLEFGSH